MQFSKIIIPVAVAVSFLATVFGSASAASKVSQPHSDVTLEMFMAPLLAVPGQQAAIEKPAGVRVAGRRGRRVVGGLIALGAAAIIINEINRSNRRHRVYRKRPRRNRSYSRYRTNRFSRCDRLLRRCDRGNRRACRIFYRRCDF